MGCSRRHARRGDGWIAVAGAGSTSEGSGEDIEYSGFQVFGDFDWSSSTDTYIKIDSPKSIDVQPPQSGQRHLEIRILNLSPATDLLLRWRSKGHEWSAWDKNGKLANSRRCAIKPDIKEWQNVVCYFDADWHGDIDQIGLVIAQRTRGDLWINSVEVLEGERESETGRTDLMRALGSCQESIFPAYLNPNLTTRLKCWITIRSHAFRCLALPTHL